MSRNTAASAIAARFFSAYIRHNPEEASTLGLAEGAHRLRNHDAGALQDELRFYASTQGQLEALERGSLDEADQHDLLVMDRVVSHHCHLGSALYGTVDWSMYPCTMIQMQLAHATGADEWEQAGQRMAATADFLAQHQQNLEAADAEGRQQDAQLCGYFCNVQLPAAAKYFAEDVPRLLATAASDNSESGLSREQTRQLQQQCEAAAQAYVTHQQWLTEQILPNAANASCLGETEVVWRLQHTLGIQKSPSALVAHAESQLADLHRQFIALAHQVATDRTPGGEPIASMDDARVLANEMQAATIASDAEVIPTYRAYIDRALQLAADKALFHIPSDYRIGIVPLPPGLDHVGHAANWPAPLCDPSKLGHFAVASDAQAHSLAWAADLAIHEGFPGHHLQSLCWQRRFAQEAAPVRFLLVHDQVAVPRHYWGAMLNIEGYAVYAEELMRKAGLFTPAEELFVLLAHAVRAARVVVDLKLHCGSMTAAEATEYLVKNVCFSESVAQREVRRYLQIPLQASTYMLGRLAIEQLKEGYRAKRGDSYREADFHDQFFSYGPLPPDAIAKSMLG